MLPHKVIWIPIAITVAVAALLWSLRPEPAVSRSEQESKKPPLSFKSVDHEKPASTDPLAGTFDQLKASPDALKSLQDLQGKLAKMNPAEAVTWMRDFLKSGKDKDTGLTFEIGSDHAMKQWPTFRTFLLDALRAIDPTAAAEISYEILSKPTTADEWALATECNIDRGVMPSSTDPKSVRTLATIIDLHIRDHVEVGKSIRRSKTNVHKALQVSLGDKRIHDVKRS